MAFTNIITNLPEGINFIEKALKNKDQGGILVHCVAGQSRSVSMVVAYLM